MTNTFDPFAKTYNNEVDDVLRITGYDTGVLTKAKLKKLNQLFPDLASRNFNLLDFGCGIGNLFEQLHNFFPHTTYTGVDKSNGTIEQARFRFSGHSVFHELESDRWRNQKYDLIFSSGVFHHIPHRDHKDILKELYDLLNPEGKLVIWEHNPFNPFTKSIVKDCIFDRDAKLITPFLMKKNMLSVSFTNIQTLYTTFFPKSLSSLNMVDPYLSWLPLGGQFLTIGKKIG
jgi:SAM-dependent methyltransferase